jgi:hypothetical protein
MAFAYSDLPETAEEAAKEIVRRYVDLENAGNARFEVRLISFVTVLDEWTAIVVTDIDHTRYELTCDTDTDRIHMNVFRHHESVTIDI